MYLRRLRTSNGFQRLHRAKHLLLFCIAKASPLTVGQGDDVLAAGHLRPHALVGDASAVLTEYEYREVMARGGSLKKSAPQLLFFESSFSHQDTQGRERLHTTLHLQSRTSRYKVVRCSFQRVMSAVSLPVTFCTKQCTVEVRRILEINLQLPCGQARQLFRSCRG